MASTATTTPGEVPATIRMLIGQRQAELRRELQSLSHARSTLVHRTGDVFMVHVDLTSLWENDGGTSVSLQKKGPLPDVLREAAAEFRKANRSSDVQARWSVRVVVKDISITVPEQYWRKYVE